MGKAFGSTAPSACSVSFPRIGDDPVERIRNQIVQLGSQGVVALADPLVHGIWDRAIDRASNQQHHCRGCLPPLPVATCRIRYAFPAEFLFGIVPPPGSEAKCGTPNGNSEEPDWTRLWGIGARP